MKFEPIRKNLLLDVHSDPMPGWDRIAVACGWDDAEQGRRRFPHAAVVGPLRTPRGIDELIRNLLFNPQIRILIVDGPDTTIGPSTWGAFDDLWVRGDVSRIDPELLPHLPLLLGDSADGHRGVQPMYRHEFIENYDRSSPSEPNAFSWIRVRTLDRDGGRIFLPPPLPKADEPAPHGDPGDRIAASTVADAWPRVLRQAMTAGRTVETQYGPTRELLCLTSVIRDPAATAEEASSDPAAEAYHEQVTGLVVPPGRAYTYGSRLNGVGTSSNQLHEISNLLKTSPGTRAAYATPWRPEEDAGIESGRPCLVGIWFRVVDGQIHLVVAFRSHDLFGAYRANLSALCMMLVRWARILGHEVGTLTCTSYSAHVYERDWNDANDVIKGYRRKGLRMDRRSNWYIEQAYGEDGTTKIGLRATALDPGDNRPVRIFEAKTGGALRAKIEESGLIQEIGSALWLGSEIERVEAG